MCALNLKNNNNNNKDHKYGIILVQQRSTDVLELSSKRRSCYTLRTENWFPIGALGTSGHKLYIEKSSTTAPKMITGHPRNDCNIIQDWMFFIKTGLEVVNPSGCYLQHNGRESCTNRHGVAGNYTERWDFMTFSIF